MPLLHERDARLADLSFMKPLLDREGVVSLDPEEVLAKFRASSGADDAVNLDALVQEQVSSALR